VALPAASITRGRVRGPAALNVLIMEHAVMIRAASSVMNGEIDNFARRVNG
jgi:hypothetical protein